LKVVVEPSEDGGFFIECPSLQGCYTSGKTFDEAVNNIREAIRAHIEDRIADGEPIPKEVDLSETVETMVSVAL
jgi:predicted RNase H-like HicB family nuclease